jgi:hypothetical protein
MKKCSRCKQVKQLGEFGKNSARKDGLQNSCRECQRNYTRNHYRKNKQYYKDKAKQYREDVREWFRQWKRTLKCEQCGEDRSACLDFHHIDPAEKEFNVSYAWCWGSKKRILEEAAKCDVLCSNCHRVLHFGEAAYP